MKVANCAKENGIIVGQGLGKIKFKSVSSFSNNILMFLLQRVMAGAGASC